MDEIIVTVTLIKEEYDHMMRELAFLRALRRAGVDNWEGYDIAIDYLNEDED